MSDGAIKIFAGSTGKVFAERMCKYLGIQLGQADVFRFSDGNTFVRAGETVRGKDVYLVQPIGMEPNDEFVEILFWMDAFKRASADSVTAIMPYFSYAKGDKKDEPRVSIRARVCAECIELAGADRVVTMDLHSPQIQGFFKKPVDHLFALPVLCEYIKNLSLSNLVVVSPDVGFAKQAHKFAAQLGASVAIGDKTRTGHDECAKVLELIGDVRGKNALIVDDFSISAGTLTELARVLLEKGARQVYACLTHLMLTEAGLRRLEASPIEWVIGTDSVDNPYIGGSPKIKTVSVAPLFAEAIQCVHSRESMSPLFTKVPDKVYQSSVL